MPLMKQIRAEYAMYAIVFSSVMDCVSTKGLLRFIGGCDERDSARTCQLHRVLAFHCGVFVGAQDVLLSWWPNHNAERDESALRLDQRLDWVANGYAGAALRWHGTLCRCRNSQAISPACAVYLTLTSFPQSF